MVQWLNVHEVLYNKKLQNYKDTMKKAFLWQEQADEMGVNVDELKVCYTSLYQAEQEEVRGWCSAALQSRPVGAEPLPLPGAIHLRGPEKATNECKYMLNLLYLFLHMYCFLIFTFQMLGVCC